MMVCTSDAMRCAVCRYKSDTFHCDAKFPSDGGMEGWKSGRVVGGVAIRFVL